MPVKVYKYGKKWTVKDSAKGKIKKGRTHTSKAKAQRQARAINRSISLTKKGKK